MKIEQLITEKVAESVRELYGKEVSGHQVQLAKTRRDVQGNLTLEIGRAHV